MQLEHDSAERKELSKGGVTVTDANGTVLAKHSSYQTSATKKVLEDNTAQLRFSVKVALRAFTEATAEPTAAKCPVDAGAALIILGSSMLGEHSRGDVPVGGVEVQGHCGQSQAKISNRACPDAAMMANTRYFCNGVQLVEPFRVHNVTSKATVVEGA